MEKRGEKSTSVPWTWGPSTAPCHTPHVWKQSGSRSWWRLSATNRRATHGCSSAQMSVWSLTMKSCWNTCDVDVNGAISEGWGTVVGKLGHTLTNCVSQVSTSTKVARCLSCLVHYAQSNEFKSTMFIAGHKKHVTTCYAEWYHKNEGKQCKRIELIICSVIN